MEYVISFVALSIIFGLIDAIWLKTMRPVYEKELHGLLREKPRMVPAVIFYAIYVIGVVVFVIMPAVQANAWWQAGLMGVLFGIASYATYDLTNLATLKNWSNKIAVIDIIWGGAVTAVSSAFVAWLVMQW